MALYNGPRLRQRQCVSGGPSEGKAFDSAKPADPFDAEKTPLPVKTAAEAAEGAIGRRTRWQGIRMARGYARARLRRREPRRGPGVLLEQVLSMSVSGHTGYLGTQREWISETPSAIEQKGDVEVLPLTRKVLLDLLGRPRSHSAGSSGPRPRRQLEAK